MNEITFGQLMIVITMLGTKDSRTKEETLAYTNCLGYAGALARFNRLVVEAAIDQQLDTNEPISPRPGPRDP